jgi:hypothetical protein
MVSLATDITKAAKCKKRSKKRLSSDMLPR